MLELRRLCAVTCLVATIAFSVQAGAMSTGVTEPPPPGPSSVIIHQETDEIVASETTVEEMTTVEQWLAIQSSIMQTLLSVL